MLDVPSRARSIRILRGDVRAALATLPGDHFDCVVTSPPYWGMRDYGVAGQIGLEPTLGGHLAAMVEVFRDVRRVLKPSGTLWLNYGDCYATAPKGRSAADTKAAGSDDRTFRDEPFSTAGPVHRGKRIERGQGRWGGGNNFDAILKPKDLAMVPNRLAIDLQSNGWWVRSEIIWHKPNPMPESITDRPTSSHEKIWLLTKSERYFYDADAIAAILPNRNSRNVWTIPSAAFSEAHFATFPPELVERCLKAGCPAGGKVLDPFGGAGTTALVADGLGMDCTLIELSAPYVEIARERLADMFRRVDIGIVGGAS